MFKQKAFPIQMTKNEQNFGWLYLIAEATVLPRLVSAVLMILFPKSGNTALNIVLFALNFLVVLLAFRRYLQDSVPHLKGSLRSILCKAVLALVVSRIAGAALNWLLYLLYPRYFVSTAFGPLLQNLNDQTIVQMAQEQYVLIALSTVILVPAAEELLHRGAVFGSLYSKSPVLACTVSTALFAGVHLLSHLGEPDRLYLLLCFLQYIPPALCLCWLYAGTGSIFAPIFMHMLYNAIGIFSVR